MNIFFGIVKIDSLRLIFASGNNGKYQFTVNSYFTLKIENISELQDDVRNWKLTTQNMKIIMHKILAIQ